MQAELSDSIVNDIPLASFRATVELGDVLVTHSVGPPIDAVNAHIAHILFDDDTLSIRSMMRDQFLRMHEMTQYGNLYWLQW